MITNIRKESMAIMREEPSDSGSDLHPDEDYVYDPDKP